MKCAKCGFEDTKVLESRLSLEGHGVRRRRCCLSCNYRFTTYEKEEELSFLVKKKDGRFEPFSHDKAMRAIQTACQKRPVAINDLENLLAGIVRQLHEDGERVVDSQKIGDLIMLGLRELDQVAYVRFASVYKSFKDPDEFITELEALKS